MMSLAVDLPTPSPR